MKARLKIWRFISGSLVIFIDMADRVGAARSRLKP
jgi:hypothetical protein